MFIFLQKINWCCYITSQKCFTTKGHSTEWTQDILFNSWPDNIWFNFNKISTFNIEVQFTTQFNFNLKMLASTLNPYVKGAASLTNWRKLRKNDVANCHLWLDVLASPMIPNAWCHHHFKLLSPCEQSEKKGRILSRCYYIVCTI